MTAVNVQNAAFLEKNTDITPAVSSRPGQTAHDTDCHPLALCSFHFLKKIFIKNFYFGELAACSAGTLDTQVLVSLCALL